MITADASAAVLRAKCVLLSSDTALNLVGGTARVRWGQINHV